MGRISGDPHARLMLYTVKDADDSTEVVFRVQGVVSAVNLLPFTNRWVLAT